MKTISSEMIEGLIEQLQATQVGPMGEHDAQRVLEILTTAVDQVERVLADKKPRGGPGSVMVGKLTMDPERRRLKGEEGLPLGNVVPRGGGEE